MGFNSINSVTFLSNLSKMIVGKSLLIGKLQKKQLARICAIWRLVSSNFPSCPACRRVKFSSGCSSLANFSIPGKTVLCMWSFSTGLTLDIYKKLRYLIKNKKSIFRLQSPLWRAHVDYQTAALHGDFLHRCL